MLGDADGVTRWVADTLVTGSLQGAVVIAIVWLATRRIEHLPASVQAALWWLAALKLVLTLVPAPALSIPVLPVPAGPSATPGVQSHVGITAVSGTPSPPAASPVQSGPTLSPERAGNARRWLAVLVGAWLLGVGVQAVRLLWALRALRAIIARSVAPVAEDTGLVEELARVIGLTAVPRVRGSDEIEAPQVVGVRRPIVLVPTMAGRTLTRDERAMALGHELMHIRRHDLALGWIPALAERLFFFHPLARVAAREYITAREAACDAAVVRALGVSPHDYGRLLVRVGVTGARSAFAAGGASPSISSLKRRLDMLQHLRSTALDRRAMWCVAAVAVAMVPFHLAARTPSPQVTAVLPSVPAQESQGPTPAAPPAGALPSPMPLEPVAPQAPARPMAPAVPEHAVRDDGERGAPARTSGAGSAEQHALEEHRQMLEELREKLAALDSLHDRSDLEALRAQVAAMIERLSELSHRRQTFAMAEQQTREAFEAMQQEARLAAQQSRLAAQQAQEQEQRFVQEIQNERLEQLAREHRAFTETQRRIAEERLQLAPARPPAGSVSASHETYARGEIVALTPAADGTRPPDSRVLAVAGDHLQVTRAGILVNDVPVSGLSSDFLAGLSEETWEQTVPPGHYFVAAEERTDSGVIRFWGLIPSDRLVRRPSR